MAEEGLNPWCEDHWDRIRQDQHYNSIAAAPRLVQSALHHEAFMRTVGEEYDGDVQDAMAALSPLCCWLEEQDGDVLETVYDDVRMDEPTGVEIDTSHEV